MKKFFCALLIVMLFAGFAFADAVRVGMLSKLNISQEDFDKFLAGLPASKFQTFRSQAAADGVTRKFYDSLTSLLMALNAGEIDEVSLPEDVAEYVMNVNDNYEISAITRTTPRLLSFGFRADDTDLRNKINGALLSMKADGALSILQAKYIAEPGVGDPEPVKFDTFKGPDVITIKIAVTGDMPPIDFIAADGTPAGFNTAVISEVAKRIRANVELINIDSSARAAALVSGRVNAVFWFQSFKGDDIQQIDVPEGIILSESYYSWNNNILLKKK